jgi:steroid 5-alpha reductase family enzyme
MWGILFIIPNAVVLIVNKNWNHRTILVLTLVTLWGLRLAYHIGRRHTRGEDYRYVAMRERWMAKGKCNYYFSAFMYIFTMQALFSLVINSSALMVSLWSTSAFFPLDIIGAAVWLFGFIFEVVGDW